METTMPPTTHVIPDTDRQRLVRSIRKIGSVLGETPLLEANSAPAHQHSSSSTNAGSRRLGPFFQSLSSLSLSPSDASSSKSDSGTLRTLPHTSIPVPARPRCVRAATSTPLSNFSPSLASPLTPPDNDDSTRRRTMAKLTRTLGENVPPELRRRRASTLIMPESALEQMTFAAAGTLAVERDAGGGSSINSGGLGLKRALSFVSLRSATAPPEVPASSMSPTAEVHVHPMRSSDEEDTPNPASEWLHATKEPRTGPSPRMIARLQGPRAPATSREYAIPHRRAQEFALHRREGSWTGDWEGNVGNMDDVMQRLRGLRAK
ncbi:hypothetical protein B0H10DRAFT_2119586 [Mycena sp. CBHHK59/15]|nr:hypothetical protein B0H10DRAFT_2119586 [Mycena sp. CBHHK59/15]